MQEAKHLIFDHFEIPGVKTDTYQKSKVINTLIQPDFKPYILFSSHGGTPDTCGRL